MHVWDMHSLITFTSSYSGIVVVLYLLCGNVLWLCRRVTSAILDIVASLHTDLAMRNDFGATSLHNYSKRYRAYAFIYVIKYGPIYIYSIKRKLESHHSQHFYNGWGEAECG